MQLFLLILKLFLKIKRSQDLELLAIGSLSVRTCAWNLVPIWSKTHHWVIYFRILSSAPMFWCSLSPDPLKQDEDFPASELNKGVSGRGWQSSRHVFFCSWPETHYKWVNLSLSKDLLLIVTTTNNFLNCVEWKHKI